MDKDNISKVLSEFCQNPSDSIPDELEEYLKKIAQCGETWFAWTKVKPLFMHKLSIVIDDWVKKNPDTKFPELPNVDNVDFEKMKSRVIEAADNFIGAPFTIQRLCELLTKPNEHYKATDKFLRGLEKNLMVVSTVDPFGNKIVSESKMLVNGMDSNGFEVEKTELSPYLVPGIDNGNVTQLLTSSSTDHNTTSGDSSTAGTSAASSSSWYSSSISPSSNVTLAQDWEQSNDISAMLATSASTLPSTDATTLSAAEDRETKADTNATPNTDVETPTAVADSQSALAVPTTAAATITARSDSSDSCSSNSVSDSMSSDSEKSDGEKSDSESGKDGVKDTSVSTSSADASLATELTDSEARPKDAFDTSEAASNIPYAKQDIKKRETDKDESDEPLKKRGRLDDTVEVSEAEEVSKESVFKKDVENEITRMDVTDSAPDSSSNETETAIEDQNDSMGFETSEASSCSSDKSSEPCPVTASESGTCIPVDSRSDPTTDECSQPSADIDMANATAESSDHEDVGSSFTTETNQSDVDSFEASSMVTDQVDVAPSTTATKIPTSDDDANEVAMVTASIANNNEADASDSSSNDDQATKKSQSEVTSDGKQDIQDADVTTAVSDVGDVTSLADQQQHESIEGGDSSNNEAAPVMIEDVCGVEKQSDDNDKDQVRPDKTAEPDQGSSKTEEKQLSASAGSDVAVAQQSTEHETSTDTEEKNTATTTDPSEASSPSAATSGGTEG